jgi:HrpA-like RNA helicase
MNLLPPAPQTLLSAKNLYNSVLQGVPPPLPASGASPPINAASRGSPSPSATAAAPTTWVPANAPALHNLDIQQVLQRMGISAHVAATPPSKMSAAATPVSATTTVSATDAVSSSPSTIPGINSGATEQLLQMLPQQQQQQQQQRGPPPPQPPLLQQLLEVPLNFYSTAAGATAGQRLPPQQRQQPQRSGQRNGRGRGGWQHFDPSQLQQQHSREQAGLPGYTQNSRAPPPAPPPVSQLTAQDPETLARFKKEYAQQEDAENVSEELKAQQASKLGTVGTLDEEVCLSLIESHDVTFVITDTGTGKSTRIPIALHKTHPDALIVNAQPRRTAAINLARRVAEVLDAKLGDEVGYSVRGEHIGDLGDTKVMYVTTYSLFIYFLWHEFKEKLPFTYIIVDEFHERTPDVEVILLMLKLWLKKHPKAFKLILCSATAQVEEWHNFFDGLNVGTYSRSPIMYPVREYFIEDLQKLVGFRTAPIEPQDSNNMVTSQQMHQLILVCKQLLEYLAKNTATQDSVLVFMPGRTQVELMTTWMRDNLEESVEPIAWYRDVELSVIQEALARSAVTRKKVYVATDIAEVSLTLPDVVFVIDAGTGKRPQVSAKEQTSYAFPPLRLLWETASNAQQRRGRVGRVQQGFYFSLLSQEHHKSLRESENRIKNAVLTELVLHSLLITQKPFAFFQLCNEKPDHGALSYSLHLLQDGGLIIRKDDALAEAERVALDRPCTSHVMDSPWNELIENALAAGAETAPTLGEKAAAPSSRQTDVKQNSNAAEGEANHRGDVDEDDNGANEDEEVRIPDAGDDAFQQCYYMTLRGVIAARAPVSVAAATNIFYGLLCGTPTLSMLAAAIESSKSPFHVPYTINNRVERAGMVRAVSQAMQRYHGSLQSDLICAMEVILEYMSMQRDGLSEEAQEEWCQERSVSRTRVVDTLNLFAQMKEQVSSVLPFPDVNDIDVLTAQFNQNAELLVLMLVASHTELAIQVQLDGPVAQRKGFVGHGMFFPLKCLKDESVPTVCPWDRTKISVPLSLQTIQRKVLAVFSSQVEPDLFALVVLVFSFKLRYAVLDSNPVPSYLMCVSHSGVRRTFQCDVLTAQQILQLRRIQCAQLRCMQLQVEERVKASESERLSALLRSANSDFGLPESAIQTPYLIPTVLQHGLKLLVSRVRGSPAFTALRQPITDFPAGTAYCKLQHAAELAPPILQSVLIHSSNGLSVAQPAASPVSSKSVEANSSPSAAAAASPVLPSTAAAEVSETVASKSDAEDDGEASAKSSESSSESGSEDHVATFRYDL